MASLLDDGQDQDWIDAESNPDALEAANDLLAASERLLSSAELRSPDSARGE